jgi:hypothetical protein
MPCSFAIDNGVLQCLSCYVVDFSFALRLMRCSLHSSSGNAAVPVRALVSAEGYTLVLCSGIRAVLISMVSRWFSMRSLRDAGWCYASY